MTSKFKEKSRTLRKEVKATVITRAVDQIMTEEYTGRRIYACSKSNKFTKNFEHNDWG